MWMPASKRAWQSIRWRVEYGTTLGICKNGIGQYSHEQGPVIPYYAGHYHWGIIGDSDHVGGQWSQDGDGAGADSCGGQIYIYVNSNLEEVPVITEADREAIRMLDGVKGCTSTAGNMLNSVTTGKGTFDAIVNYADPDDEFSNNSVMACGHWYTWDDFYAGNDVAVISEADAVRMFGTTDVIGLTFEMDDGDVIKNMRIVGVKKSIDGAFVATGYGDAYLDINVPYTSDSYWAQFNDFDNVYVFSQNSSGTKEIAQEVKGLLEARHGMTGQDAFLIEDFESQMASVMQVLSMITIFIMLVAAISLLVGGIGVMNIMLVSVTERTREIGIRKALGARTKSILVQFLAESAIITGIGGVIGIVLGIGGAYAICALPMVSFSPSVSMATVLTATIFSCGVGIFFGIYPARKAAHLSPIEALRRN